MSIKNDAIVSFFAILQNYFPTPTHNNLLITWRNEIFY